MTKKNGIRLLKQMADLPVFPIVILTVSGQHAVHHPANRIVLHLCQQMNVIGHQAVRIKVKREFRFLALKKTQKLEPVVVRSEYPLAIIPTRNQVVEATCYFNSWLPCHSRQP